MHGVRLAALKLPPGWLKQHRNVASEIVKSPDVATLRQSNLHVSDVVSALAAKARHLRVLVVGWMEGHVDQLLSSLQRASTDVELTILESQGTTDFASVQQYLSPKGSLRVVHSLTDALSNVYDLGYVFFQCGLDIASLQSCLSPHGAVILPASLDFETAYLQSDHGSVDLSRIISVTTWDGEGTLLGASPPNMPDSITVLVPEAPTKLMTHLVNGLIQSLRSSSSGTIRWINPADVGHGLRGEFVISLLHLDDSKEARKIVRDIVFLRNLVSYAANVLFLCQPMLENGIHGAEVTGLIRTLRSEDNITKASVLNLSPRCDFFSQGIYIAISDCIRQINDQDAISENEYEERSGTLYIPRLRLAEKINAYIDKDLCVPENVPFSSNSAVLAFSKSVGPRQSLMWQTIKPNPDIQASQILVQRTSMSITTRDVCKLLSQKSSTPCIGSEFFGVWNNKPVVGLMKPQDVRSSVITDSRLVLELCFDHGAFSLVGYLAAVTALVDHSILSMSRTSKGDMAYENIFYVGQTVLVVGADTVEGLQMVRVAVALGYEVFALVSSAQAVETIVGEQVPVCNVYVGKVVAQDDLSFDKAIVAANHDISAMKCRALFSMLKTSVPCRASAQYLWDLDALLEDNIPFLQQLLRVFDGLVSCGRISLSRSPFVYEAPSIDDAISHLEESPSAHVMVTFPSSLTVPVLNLPLECGLSSGLCADGLYIIVGSPSSLAGVLARSLAFNGARHIVFLSRSATRQKQDPTVQLLQDHGVTVQLMSVDITDFASLKSCVATLQYPRAGISGIIQTAGVLRDGLFSSMSQEDWDVVMQPKVQGSKNIVRVVDAVASDYSRKPWFLFLSSAAGIIGNRGQANYAAANTFLDGLASHLRDYSDYPATSLAFGPIMGPGMLSRSPEVMKMLKASGFYGIRECDFVKTVNLAISGMASDKQESFPVTVALGLGTGGLLIQMKVVDPYWRDTAIYTHLAKIDLPEDSKSTKGEEANEDSQPPDYTTVDGVVIALSGALAERLEMAPDSIDTERSMLAYGLDSFSGFWLRKWVEDRIGVSVPVFEIIGDVSVLCLARNVMKRLATVRVE